jgi:DNA-binding NarL/FixJ family response regulator
MTIVASQMKPSILKIVIVDDSPLIVSRLRQVLDALDEVEISGVAQDVHGAFVLIEECEPDAVILDIYLEENAPAGNGLTLLAVLTEGFPNIQVIMLTNLSGPAYRNKCIKMGAKYFLDKTNEFERVPEILLQMAGDMNTSIIE